MVTLGVDAHKRTHTVVAVDTHGRQLAVKTIGTNTKDHLALLTWAERLAGDGESLLWAVEDCRHLSRRRERDLLAAGQAIVRVPPKLMAHVRDSARTYGKSDPIDALSPSRGRRNASPTSQSHVWTVQTATSGCSPTTANPLSTSGLGWILPAAMVPARARPGLGTQATITGPHHRPAGQTALAHRHPGNPGRRQVPGGAGRPAAAARAVAPLSADRRWR
jgi:hypothetical protein